MFSGALDAPNDAEAFTVHTEPTGPNMMRNTAADELTFFATSTAVLLVLLALGILLAKGARKLRVWRLLSFLILLASFLPAAFDFQNVRAYLLGVTTSEPAATLQRIERAVAVFTTITLWCLPVLLLVGIFVLWRLPWTVTLMPLSVSAGYWFFPYLQLEKMIYGTYVTVDGLIHLWFFAYTLLLYALALGWLWGRNPKNLLPVRSILR